MDLGAVRERGAEARERLTALLRSPRSRPILPGAAGRPPVRRLGRAAHDDGLVQRALSGHGDHRGRRLGRGFLLGIGHVGERVGPMQPGDVVTRPHHGEDTADDESDVDVRVGGIAAGVGGIAQVKAGVSAAVGEIAELRWSPLDAATSDIAPLLREHVMPALRDLVGR